jgi:hypothetical protein
MQFAKDSFYVTLRERLATVNAARTAVVDGVLRPAIVVGENQAATAARSLPETFYVQFGGMRKAGAGARALRPLLALECSITYFTAGVNEGGSDRGRTLAALDSELLAICAPPSTPKCDYGQTPATALGTAVLWDAPQFGDTEPVNGGLRRVARLTLYFFPEGDS